MVFDEMMLLPVSQSCWSVEPRKMDGMQPLLPGSQCCILYGEILHWLMAKWSTPAVFCPAAFILEVTVPQQRRRLPWTWFYTAIWGGHWHKVIA